MSDAEWAKRPKVSTVFSYMNFGPNGELQVSRQSYKGTVMTKGEIVTELQNASPSYSPSNPDMDPLFFEANGYCRLVYAFDPKLSNWLFSDASPFQLKPRANDPNGEFGSCECVTRGDMGNKSNPNAVVAFFIDDRNTKKDPDLILYDLHMLISQDSADAGAYLTKITLDPGIRNNNG